MSADLAGPWLTETRRISKLRSWHDGLWKMCLGFAFLGLLFFTAAIALRIHDNKSEATCGIAGGINLFLAFVVFFLTFFVIKRLRQSVAALECVEGSARAGLSEKRIKQGCYLKLKNDVEFFWIGDTFQADHPDLVWACERFGSGAKWHKDYNFPLDPKIKVELLSKYEDLTVAVMLTFTARRMETDPGRLLVDFGPFDSTIGKQLNSILLKRAEELLPNNLEFLRLDGSLADKLALSATLKLPDNSISAPYRVESVEISDVKISSPPLP